MPGKPEIVFFPRRRIIGISTLARGAPDCGATWDRLLPREQEIAKPPSALAFGVCACSTAADGTFEYIAAFAAAPDAPVPPGMKDWQLGGVDHAVIRVPTLAAVGQGWDQVKTLTANPALDPYCGPKGCHCDQHPPFELYPADFTPDSEFFIYVPLQKRPV
jgi:predicted transcriptional regulator YdeE